MVNGYVRFFISLYVRLPLFVRRRHGCSHFTFLPFLLKPTNSNLCRNDDINVLQENFSICLDPAYNMAVMGNS